MKPSEYIPQLEEEVNEATTPGQLPEMVDAAEFVKMDLPEPKQLVHGLAFLGDKISFSGGSKSFKTWLLVCLALCVSHGRKWLDFTTTKGRVLWIDFELKPFAIQRRLKAVASALGIEIEPGAISILPLRGYAADFATLLPKIQRAASSQPFDLILFDPLYKLLGSADENAASDMAALLNGFDKLSVETGAAVGYSQHFSKGGQAGKNSIDRASGSGVFARDPDSLIVMTPHTEADCFTIEATLRNFAPVVPFVVRWSYPVFERDTELDPSDLRQSLGRPKAYDPAKLLAAITDSSAENPISIAAWAHAGKCPRQTLTDYMPEMRSKGWIKTTGEGRVARQYITENGRKIAEGGTCR